MGRQISYILLLAAGFLVQSMLAQSVFAETCPEYQAGDKQIFWGDLHVHSGYSLDAWGYGTATTPAESYAFAKGATLKLADGSRAKLPRPLDFMAVTDHAEWFNLMYRCTDPQRSDHAYCNILTEKNTPATGSEVFAEYVLPTITRASPQPTPICREQPDACRAAHLSQWQRIQQQANEANEPCQFTAFVGYEWSATPDFSHNHRNVIFASEQVPQDAFDYMRYPTPERLWQQLQQHCTEASGCDVLVIPHNTNMGDGKSFDVEVESPAQLQLRAKYERLVEIHQEKGNSECLPAFGQTDEDCTFERYLTKNSRPTEVAGYTQEEWQRMRGSYVRRLLLRGLYGYQQSAERQLNPLQLGIIGSTDNHAGTGGFVDEENWPGSVFGLGDFDQTMVRSDFNPGGLVAVWAEQNTRASIFAALKRREVYATSGPRMRLKLDVKAGALSCEGDAAEHSAGNAVVMGGTYRDQQAPVFRIHAQADRTPIAAIEIVKGTLIDGQMAEEVVDVWRRSSGAADKCVTWLDADFDPQVPAFWYARVLQTPTPRWTAYQCQRAGRCDEFTDADRWIRERGWTSPVWYLPAYQQR